MRRLAAAAQAAALSALCGAPFGCTQPCAATADCTAGNTCVDGACAHACTTDAECDAPASCDAFGQCSRSRAEVAFVRPEDDTRVDARFDAAVHVGFRGASATLRVERAPSDPGNPCAPFAPTTLVLDGARDAFLSRDVEIPGLHAVGARFRLLATLTAPGGTLGAVLSLRGPDDVDSYGGATIQTPTEGTINAAALETNVVAMLAQTETTVAAFTEPDDGAPSPIETVGTGIDALTARVPIVVGPQTLWVLLGGAASPRRCGIGLVGTTDLAAADIEFALLYAGHSDALVGLHVVDERGDDAVVCNDTDTTVAGGRCSTVIAPDRVTTRGGVALRVAAPPNATSGTLRIAAVPRIAGEPVRLLVRVTAMGKHLGFLGPMTIVPAAGEKWVAGSVVVNDGIARLVNAGEVVTTVPF